MQITALLAAVGLASLAQASPKPVADKSYQTTEADVNYHVFEHAATQSTMKYVNNSGICETTPGVNQYSGYIDVASDQHMWFWFFESRNNADTAPLVLWLNGGPGCSSMIGLFQEHGPCTFNDGGSEPKLNPNSWNNVANMLYVDQPIGAGFSYGTQTAGDTIEAAPAVWTFVQSFLTKFPQYKSREFALFTESYGGHYGPEFAHYFQQQNDAISSGSITGITINLFALGVNNGWIDPVNQYKAYPEFAVQNQYNQLIDQDTANNLIQAWNDQCVPAMSQCTATGDLGACSDGDSTCSQYVEDPIGYNGDPYDVRASSDSFPPGTYSSYLNRADIKKAIGATSTYTECGNVGIADDGRSYITELGDVVNSGIQVLMWAGDADWICNWVGNLEAANTVGGSDFANLAVQDYTVNGQKYGEFKFHNNLNWLRVYGAGHEVPAYQPVAALAAFTSIINKKNLSAS